MNLKIAGLGRGIPKRSVTNDELAEFLDTSDEWIVPRTGIKSRFICTDESLTDLCETAANQALRNAGVTAGELDLIIATTIGGDYSTPSLAFVLAESIHANCPAFDINAACAGFIYALDAAAAYLETNRAKKILIVSAEKMSRHINWSDRSTCILFGDGAGAAVVTPGDSLKYCGISAENNTRVLNLPTSTGTSPFATVKAGVSYLHMDGGEVFKFAVSSVARETAKALEACGLSPDDIDFYVLHQANKRIINSIRTRMKLPEEKFPVNIDRYGNMSSASVPVLLSEMSDDGRLKRGDKLLLCAFGAGLTTATSVLIWDN